MDKAFKGTGCESGIAIFACKESLEIMFTVPLIQRNKQTSKKSGKELNARHKFKIKTLMNYQVEKLFGLENKGSGVC